MAVKGEIPVVSPPLLLYVTIEKTIRREEENDAGCTGRAQ